MVIKSDQEKMKGGEEKMPNRTDMQKGEPVLLSRYTCLRCNHKWLPRSEDYPRVCPRCKSAYWDVPKEENENEKLKK